MTPLENINNLEASLGRLETWLVLMTALVVLGLVVEYWYEIPDAISDIKKAGKWIGKPVLTIVGAILITIGVAGEFIVEFKASGKETALRKANDGIFTDLNTEAAGARLDAGRAIERAAKADERASANEKEASRLAKLAEDERFARVKIEESVAWRKLTKEEQNKIASRLAPFSGQVAALYYNANDVEASNFGTDIALALQAAKWRVTEPLAVLKMHEGPVPLGTNPPLPTGVVVSSTGDKGSRDASDALARSLADLGFDSSKDSDIDRGNSVLRLWIEHRPNGAQGEAKLRAKQ